MDENTIIAAAVYSVMRARKIGKDMETGGALPDGAQWKSSLQDSFLAEMQNDYEKPWELASMRTHEEFVSRVGLIRGGVVEEGLYALRPSKVRAGDVAAQEYKVEGAGEGEHKALKEGDTVPYEDLPIEDKMWFTLFVETVHTMHRVLTPPINADRLTRTKQKASER